MISYLITDQKYYGNTKQSIRETLLKVAEKHKIDYACLRDKNAKDYEDLAETFIAVCNDLDTKPILHTFWQQTIILGAYGVHFSTKDFENIPLAKERNIFTLASAHSLKEANKALFLGADIVTISPIFYTPDKNEPLGLEKLKEITDKIPHKCIALGGILESSQIDMCKKAGAIGYASIRYFLI
ncbi:MAG: thiamine phosphate synthase [Campylobacteraceae bacterium]|jgi:thiamine-phosphate pyrophosphorylase|nr:thiamine phosphate synthase [Campylobacteraceae bacterium]